MAASDRDDATDSFEENGLDPVSAAPRDPAATKPHLKKKAGFYLSEELLDRFNRHFHQMKLAGLPIENKSALLEIIMQFGIEDLDKTNHSRLMKALETKGTF